MKRLCFFVVIWLNSWTALAREYPPFEPCAVPAWLEKAIVLHESGNNPFALNVNGTSYYPESEKEALQILHAGIRRKASIDLGLWQINNWWWKKYNLVPEHLFNAKYNSIWGKWILSEEIKRHGLTWKAVGKYHSPNQEKGRKYTWNIFNLATKNRLMEGLAYAKQIKTRSNVPNRRGIIRSKEKCGPGRIITFQIPETHLYGTDCKKP